MEPSYQKLIHDYLEGTLSEEEERRLFDNFSANPEWREELNFQMRMHEAMQKDMSSITIPAKTTASVFSALTFSIPQKAATSMFSRILQYSSVYKPMLGILSLSLLGAVLYLYSPNHSETGKSIPPSNINTHPLLSRNNLSEPERHPLVPTAVNDARHIAKISEDHKTTRDIGKFSSVDYLTKTKLVGISSKGNIYLSDDGGTFWKTLRSNTTRDLYGIHFRDTSNGLVVGAAGTILLTADAGEHWASVASGTDASLIAVRYVTRDTVYACGSQGTILLSTSGGLIWKKLQSGITESLFNIHFENARKGSIGGEHGVLLQTVDGGITWEGKKDSRAN